MRWGELAGVALKVVILGDEGSARCSSVGEYIGVGPCAQADIVGVFRLIALIAEIDSEPRWQIFVYEKASA